MRKFTNSYKFLSLLLSVMIISSCGGNETAETTKKKLVPKTSENNGQIVLDIDDDDADFTTTGTTSAAETKKASEETTVDKESVFTFAEDDEDEFVIAYTEETTAAEITTEETTTAASETTTTAAPVNQGVENSSYNVIGENGILVSYQNGHYIGLMGCFGTYDLCDGWIKSVNTFKQKLPDVNVYNLIAPTSSEFYTPEKLFSGFTTRQLNKIEYIRDGLDGVKNVDAYTALESHTNEPIYARTDHHWQPLGAYYAAMAFAKEAGVAFPDLSEYKKVVKSGYVGSMYTYSKDSNLYNDAEDFVMYLPPNYDELKTTYYNTSFAGGYEGNLFPAPDGGAYYCSFLGTDQIIAKVETGVKNGRTLVIFKESYGNGMVPFLTSGFETIYVCDIRYFTPNAVSFCKEVGATDLLFAVCTFTPAGTNGRYLNTIMNQ